MLNKDYEYIVIEKVEENLFIAQMMLHKAFTTLHEIEQKEVLDKLNVIQKNKDIQEVINLLVEIRKNKDEIERNNSNI